MVGNGNHPLNQSHYDEITLQEYVLGQLLPDEEDEIRQHLTTCAMCRMEVAALQAFCQQLSADLDRELEDSTPPPRLSFDKIGAEWHRPPRRVSFLFRLQQLMPSTSTVMLLTLFALGFLLLLPGSETAALRSLELPKDYYGPSAMVAASTDGGLAVVRLLRDDVQVVEHLPYITNPQNLQFSPDSRWLAVQQKRTLHVIDTTNSDVHAELKITDSADWNWSPDSQTLAYTDGTGQLIAYDVVTQTGRVLVPADEYAWGVPVWTADGSQIAYAVVVPLPSEGETRVRQGIWRVNPATGYRVELARNALPDVLLLIPAAWVDDNSALLAWDVQAGVAGDPVALYRVDVNTHHVAAVSGQSLAQGTRLAWPVSSTGVTLAVDDSRLVALSLADGSSHVIADQIPWPQVLDWAPNGAWLAYTVAGAAEGQGLFVYALQEAELRLISLPGGATEKSVAWAGPEHLFVIRQTTGNNPMSELWLVSLTTDQAPQRVMTNVRVPKMGPYNGWRWQDVLTTQVITATE